MLNNDITSNETDLNRSNLINFISNDSINDDAEYRNINKSNNDTLNIVDNKFITNTNFSSGENINSFIIFKIPIFLNDINDFFRKTILIHNGEFNINIELIKDIFASDRDIKDKIKNCYLIVEEIRLNESDNVKYLKMLYNNYTKKINFLENQTAIFKDDFKK